jgi:hypothetical protein
MNCDHLVYSPNEISLDDAIGALEAHKVSMQVPFNQSQETFAALAVAKKKKPGCWSCGEFGHHSSSCPNLSAKNKPKAKFGTQAGAALDYEYASTRTQTIMYIIYT